ncbi:hypothetical protein BDW59DRAFT_155461 [Aspergillus cavernicola]|uniref:Uncharacterized protein n=1 Tax=Aspergillus cavernicola TaxID=176166 RepID=A0ABR4H8T5_9EURO
MLPSEWLFLGKEPSLVSLECFLAFPLFFLGEPACPLKHIRPCLSALRNTRYDPRASRAFGTADSGGPCIPASRRALFTRSEICIICSFSGSFTASLTPQSINASRIFCVIKV